MKRLKDNIMLIILCIVIICCTLIITDKIETAYNELDTKIGYTTVKLESATWRLDDITNILNKKEL